MTPAKLNKEQERIMATADYYARLLLAPKATPEDIKAAHRKLAGMFHPDRCAHPAAADTMAQLNVAYSTLSDPAARKHYDLICGHNKPCTLCGGKGTVKVLRGFKPELRRCKCQES